MPTPPPTTPSGDQPSGNPAPESSPRRGAFLGLSPTVFALGLTSFLNDAATEMIYPFLPLFLVNTLGTGTPFLGLVEGTAETVAAALRLASGWLSDRWGRRRPLLLLGYGLSALAKPALALAGSGWHVFGLRLGDRFGKGVRTAPRDALLAEAATPTSHGRTFGFHRTMDSLGAALGPLLAFVLWPLCDGDYRRLFLFAAVPSALMMTVLLTAVKEKSRLGDVRGLGTPHPVVPGLPRPPRPALDRNFKVFIAIMGIFTLANSSDVFLLLRAAEVGVAGGSIPLVWLLMNLVYALSAWPAGTLSDRWGRKIMLAVGLGIYALSYLGLAAAVSMREVFALFAVYGLYHGLTDGAARAVVADLTPRTTRGTAFGLFHMVVALGALPASLMTGLIWSRLGGPAALRLSAGLALAAAILLVAVMRIPSPKNDKRG